MGERTWLRGAVAIVLTGGLLLGVAWHFRYEPLEARFWSNHRARDHEFWVWDRWQKRACVQEFRVTEGDPVQVQDEAEVSFTCLPHEAEWSITSSESAPSQRNREGGRSLLRPDTGEAR